MPAEDITDLVRRSAISFTGTITRLGDTTVAEMPADDRTAVVTVDRVLHAPAAFRNLSGTAVTVRLRPDADIPPVGERLALFANSLIFGRTLGLAEVDRLPASAVDPYANAATAAGTAVPFARIQDQLETEHLRAHAASADAVVIGQVLGLAQAGQRGPGEHDPDWWVATLDVRHVERGDLPTGPVRVLYANSADVRWYLAPKPAAGQRGVWLLHATDGRLRDLAPFQLADADDMQSLQRLDLIRGGADSSS